MLINIILYTNSIEWTIRDKKLALINTDEYMDMTSEEGLNMSSLICVMNVMKQISS